MWACRTFLQQGRQDSNLQPPVLETQQIWLGNGAPVVCAPVRAAGSTGRVDTRPLPRPARRQAAPETKPRCPTPGIPRIRASRGGRARTGTPVLETQPLWLNRAGGDSSAPLCAPAVIRIDSRWPNTADSRIRARQHILRSARVWLSDFERDAMNAKDMVELPGGTFRMGSIASTRRRRLSRGVGRRFLDRTSTRSRSRSFGAS